MPPRAGYLYVRAQSTMDQPSFWGTFFTGGLIYVYWARWALMNVTCAYFAYQSAIRRARVALDIGPYW